MPEVNLYNVKGENLGKVQLAEDIFVDKVNRVLLHEVVLMHLANEHKGLASTKTKGEVRGGGAKPWRQKGTGRARAGSNRSPIWRHGGVTFGPKPKSYKYSMPYKKRRIALRGALTVKLKDKKIIVLESIEAVEPKTRIFIKVLDRLNARKKTVFVVKGISENLRRFSRNISTLKVLEVSSLNTYDIMNCDKLIITRDAVEPLENLFKKSN